MKKEEEKKDKKKTCFIISPIGEIESDIRKRSDTLLKYIIKPILKTLNYDSCRADYIADPGIITNQIINNVISSDLIIADLTDHNPNVFYELAIRHAQQKPYIQMIQEGEIIPFDVSATRTISYRINDFDDAERVKKELLSSIKKIENSDFVESPISNAIDLKSLRDSGNLLQKNMANLIDMVNHLLKQ